VNELIQQASGGRSPAAAGAKLRLETEMGYQRPARQLQAEPLPIAVSVVRGECYRPGRIDELQVAGGDLRDAVILGDRRAAGDLKRRVVMLDIVEADILLRSLDAVSVAGEIHRQEAVHVPRPNPAGEGVELNAFRAVPAPIRAKHIPEAIVVQFRHGEEIVARMHRRLPKIVCLTADHRFMSKSGQAVRFCTGDRARSAHDGRGPAI
jgi:hypothetical protein